MGLVATVRMEFAGQGNGWTTVPTRDLMEEPIQLRYGISGTGPNDRVASTGTLSFALNNSAKNSESKLGLWSPNHANKKTGFKLGIGVQLILSPEGRAFTIATSSVAASSVITTSSAHGFSTGDRVEVSGHSGSTPSIDGFHTVTVLTTTTFSIPVTVTVGGTGGTATRKNQFYKFNGTLESIAPTAGLYSGDFLTRCVAVDWMNEAARQRVSGLATQTDLTSDALFDLLVASMPNQPAALEVQEGQDTYQYAFDNTRDEANAVLSEFQRLAQSELGYIYVKGDRTQGGTLVFESRRTRAVATTNLDAFLDATSNGTGLVGITSGQSRENVINKIQLVTHPRKVDAAATTVLCRLDNPTPIGANSTITLLFPYRDPSQEAARVGGIDMQTPVASTDYAANTASDGSGSDLTSSLSVTPSFGGNGVRFSITNTSGTNGFITLLQARGRGIYDFQNAILETEDAASVANYGEHAISFDMSYQSDPAVGYEASLYLVNLYKDPTSRVESANFFAPYSDAVFIDRLLRREISDRIGITEQVTGLAPGSRSLGHFIQGIDYTIDARNNLSVGFLLAPADKMSYWQLEITGRSEMDQTTVLGFGQIVGHTDIAHLDTHDDTAHQDTAHQDTAHQDTAHGDGAHDDSAHQDVSHSDTNHQDLAFSDTAHEDTAHADSHSDAAHQDAAHQDVAHGDSAHVDVPHTDEHLDGHLDFDDGGHADTHDDEHFDSAHQDVTHVDESHGDEHTDVAHADTHGDESHQDVPHDDVDHADVAHADTAHLDVAHGDGGHADVGHSDVTFSDTAHVDVAHEDDHGDVSHGDI